MTLMSPLCFACLFPGSQAASVMAAMFQCPVHLGWLSPPVLSRSTTVPTDVAQKGLSAPPAQPRVLPVALASAWTHLSPTGFSLSLHLFYAIGLLNPKSSAVSVEMYLLNVAPYSRWLIAFWIPHAAIHVVAVSAVESVAINVLCQVAHHNVAWTGLRTEPYMSLETLLFLTDHSFLDLNPPDATGPSPSQRVGTLC